MKQFCMKIDLISQGRENVLFLSSNMAAMTSHENALYYVKELPHFDKRLFALFASFPKMNINSCHSKAPARLI